MSKNKEPRQKGALVAKAKSTALQAKALWKTPAKGRYLNLKEMLSFGVFALGNSFILSAIGYVASIAFIPYFYEIDTIHAYIIVALASFINMTLLPFIGNKIERTKTRWGKYKPFILFSLPLLAIFTILAMWLPQGMEDTARIIYAYLTCTPVLVISTFCNNMYQNMPTIITPNTQERADIMTPIGLLVGLAPSILQIIVGPIRAAFGENEYMAMRVIGIVSVVLGTLCLLFILKVKERVYDLDISNDAQEEKVTFIEAMKMLSKNVPLIVFCIALILGSLRGFTGQFRWLIIQFRFAEDVKLAIQISGIPQTIIGFSATVSMFLLPLVTRKMDKRTIVILFTAISLIPDLILGIIGYENIPIGNISMVVLTILFFIAGLNPLYLLIPVIMGEIADYQQHKTGKRLDGHMQNLIFVVPNLAMNLLMICSYYIQKQIGFEAKDYTDITQNLTEAQQILACQWFDAVAIIAAVSGALMIIVMLFYPLSRKKHDAIVEELTARSTITNVDENTEQTTAESNTAESNEEITDTADQTTVENNEEIADTITTETTEVDNVTIDSPEEEITLTDAIESEKINTEDNE